MTLGGCEVDMGGGEGSNCQNNTLDHPFEGSIAVLDPRPQLTITYILLSIGRHTPAESARSIANIYPLTTGKLLQLATIKENDLSLS